MIKVVTKSFFNKIKAWAKKLKENLVVLYLTLHHRSTPWYAKGLIFLIIVYALSPIDLIPDFIPVLGYFDDLLLLPLGIFLAFKLIPSVVIEECRENAKNYKWKKKRSITGLILVITIWASFLLLLIRFF